MTPNEKSKIEQLRQHGLSAAHIAKQIGLSVNTVKAHLRRHVGKANTKPNAAKPGFCKQCGQPVVQPPRCKPKMFCSDACRMTWWNNHRDCITRSGLITLACHVCGRQFNSYEKEQRKYCSHACYIKARFGGDDSRDAGTV
jgi:endogenous inhibitor of DNA gyrase (YacG/DUF329 family)